MAKSVEKLSYATTDSTIRFPESTWLDLMPVNDFNIGYLSSKESRRVLQALPSAKEYHCNLISLTTGPWHYLFGTTTLKFCAVS